MEKTWCNFSIEDIYPKLNSSHEGLTSEAAKQKLAEYGLNKLPEAKAEGYFTIFLRQFKSPLIYILFIAGLIVLLMKEYTDGLMIFFVLIFNACVGTIQEGKAHNTLLALKKFVETKTAVLRDGKETIVFDYELVPGDVIVLREGEKVPADARILQSNNLRLDEAALTGESKPVSKITDVLEQKEMPVSEQKNMIFKGTHIVAGSGTAIVVTTGLKTVIGKITKEITTIDTEIPLKTNIRYLSRLIVIAVASIGTALFVLGLLSGKPLSEMFRTVVSLTVSIIPAGLPIVMTLILASGVWRMSKRYALIKKLQAVEALGQTKVIAVDKTGTITKNEMVVEKIFVDNEFFDVTGEGYNPQGKIKLKGQLISPQGYPELILLGKLATFSSGANLKFSSDNQWQITGDPTEAAMLVLGQKLGLNRDDLEKDSPKISEIPFDYKLKFHATVQKTDGQEILTVAGAPEAILGFCQKVWHAGKVEGLSVLEIKKLEQVFDEMSKGGLRIVALAKNDKVPENLKPEDVRSLTFVGFFGMKDALRPEVYEAMKKANLAGVKVVMITGDHKITACAVAKEAGIYQEGDEILTGEEIDKLSDLELSEKLSKVTIFARVTPEHKLKIIRAYRKRGEIIAMTGDGVNDAPSLVAADLGISMGKIGTEVAKEAADIVLQDDNFGTIISAVEEGRAIYKTIKKVILYLFSTGIGEVLTITGALFVGWPLPILPAQIIWLNLVTDGFLDVALAMEPKEDRLLEGKFKRASKWLVDSLMAKRMFLMAAPMALGALWLFQRFYQTDITKAWTISLTTLAVFQWLNAWNCRSENKSIFQMRPFSNKFLVGATIIVVSLQFLAVYNPLMQKILHTTALSLFDWILIIATGLSIVLVEEVRKLFHRRFSSQVNN